MLNTETTNTYFMFFWFEPSGDRTHDLPYINYYTTYAVALIKNLNYLNLENKSLDLIMLVVIALIA
jgi:hypothetical protein